MLGTSNNSAHSPLWNASSRASNSNRPDLPCACVRRSNMRGSRAKSFQARSSAKASPFAAAALRRDRAHFAANCHRPRRNTGQDCTTGRRRLHSCSSSTASRAAQALSGGSAGSALSRMWRLAGACSVEALVAMICRTTKSATRPSRRSVQAPPKSQ